MTYRRQWGSTVWGPPKNYEEEEVSDCSKNAWNAPRGIDGEVRWDDGTVSELHYTRYLNGHERHAREVVVDGVRYVPVPERDWDGEVCE